MTRERLRRLLAWVGIPAVTVAGLVLTSDPNEDVRPEKQVPRGYAVHVLYAGAGGLPSYLCDGLQCDRGDAGYAGEPLERTLCETKGHGVNRFGEVSGLHIGFLPVVEPCDAGPCDCIGLLRQHRAQQALGDRIPTNLGGKGEQLRQAWDNVKGVTGYGLAPAALPAKVRNLAKTSRWAGHRRHDLRHWDQDAGVTGSYDGGSL
jgi:hypothetical protein